MQSSLSLFRTPCKSEIETAAAADGIFRIGEQPITVGIADAGFRVEAANEEEEDKDRGGGQRVGTELPQVKGSGRKKSTIQHRSIGWSAQDSLKTFETEPRLLQLQRVGRSCVRSNKCPPTLFRRYRLPLSGCRSRRGGGGRRRPHRSAVVPRS